MRRLVPLAALLLALPTASAAPAPFSFVDAAGDVTQDGAPVSGAMADAADIVSTGFSETDGLEFRLELASLDGLQDDALDSSLHAQYALSFDTPDHQFSMRADLSFHMRVLGEHGWRFQIHDRGADTWTDVDGHVDGETLVWTVSPAELSLQEGDTLEAWAVSAWISQDDEEQYNDWSGASIAYRLGSGVAGAVLGGTTVLADQADDVSSGGKPYDGPGAGSTDVLAGRAWLTTEGVQFELDLADLASLEDELDEPGFHAQYAFNFDSDAGTWSTRASYRSGWDFQLHDQQSDEWPQVRGHVDGDTLVWIVPADRIGVAEGDRLRSWSVQTWNSFDERDQYGDWAESAAVIALGDPVEAEVFGPVERVVLDVDGDVTSRGTRYQGAGAPSVDVLEARVTNTFSGLRFEMDLVDLGALEAEKGEAGFHVQYALSFLTQEDHAGWSMRASFEGRGAYGDPWSFSVHDKELDDWPDVAGEIQGNTLVWLVPLEMLDLSIGDELWAWDASTWSSFDDRDQYGDDAGGAGVFTVAEPVEADILDEQVPGLALPSAALLLVALALARRR